MPKRRRPKRKPTAKRRWKTSRVLLWGGLGCLAAVMLVLGFFAFTGGDDEPRQQTPVVSDEPQFSVDVVDFDFEPRDLTVRVGTEVTWNFRGRAAHDVTDDRGAFASDTLSRGDEYARTFDEAGTFYYYCTLHHAMQGTLVVRP